MSSTLNDDKGELRDEALHRALLNAPDHTAAPNWRLRKAILDHAHDAVTPFAAAAQPEAAERPRWQRLLGLGGQGGGARMPWNAAFATVLVGVLVTVLWQREPVPGARPDRDAQVSAPAQRSEAPAAPASPPPAAPAATPAPPPQAAERALPSSQDIAGGPAPVPEAPAESATAPAKGARPSRPAERPAPTPAPSELARRQADEAALSASTAAAAKEARKKEAAAPAGQPAPAPAAAPPAPAGAAPRGSLSERTRSEEESASRQRFAAPAGPATVAGSARDAAEPAREGRAAAPPTAAPPAPTASPEPPSFSALSQWSRITITQRGGASRTLSRSEAQDLSALLGSAAISAVGAQPLAGTPEWRVTLERSNGDVMATFELGRNQVRWREGRGAAATGMPSASSLAALREALQHAVEPPAQPSSPPQWQFKPQPPAEPEPAPAAPSR
ncbi:hypothetical protein C7T35_30280 [Variovorax sp. WS11]|uniref:hypothetical protein n=1 Tax=Variovorax sp. WS11 TaxID=1105204 RepID=UPI000D0CFC2B|nr:hypothetical protein [Variovorax sp. WS11]NDZ12869.1 hypothetical protein [Variovorax sp. WS11]PSL80871.1 hypothetical protein C7T35_30280 [Variovorax sp. WS11]